jgi:hypothetical protein
MSRLEFWSRPLVAFDASLKEHRQIYYKFVEKRSWGHSPYRFICPEEHSTDLVTTIQRALIEYYVQKEFGKPAPKPEPLVRQKRKKTVDKQPKR